MNFKRGIDVWVLDVFELANNNLIVFAALVRAWLPFPVVKVDMESDCDSLILL